VLSEVNVRLHRAGKRGFDTGFVSIPTSEAELISGRVFVSGIFISFPATTGTVQVTLTESSSSTIIYKKTLSAGDFALMAFTEPMLIDGLKHVAGASGAVIKVWGYK
jgi:hypothetical protein